MKKRLLSLALVGLSFTNFAQTALNFDATDDKVACGTGISLAGGSFTIECWAQSTPSASSQHFFSMGSTVTGQGLHARIEPSGAVKLGFWSADVTSAPQATSTDGLWHHYSFTYNHLTNSQKIYVDGSMITSNTTGTDYNGSGNFYIGVIQLSGFGPQEYWNGNLDDFRVWNYERSAAEISAEMNNCLDGTETGLLALYDMEDGTGSSSLTDLTGNGNDGTLTNMDASTDWVTGFGCTSTCSVDEQTITEADFSICSAGTATVNLDGSELGNSYYLRDNSDDAVVDGPITGTGSGISFSTGTVSSTTTYNVFAHTAGVLGEGLNFDGTDDRVIGSDAGLPLGSSARTIEGWIKTDGTANSNEFIIEWGSPAVGGNECGLGLHPSGRTFFWGHSADILGPTNLDDGNWHHIAFSYDGTTGTLYADGNIEGSANLSLNTSTTGSFQLGEGNGEYLDGSIDNVSVWNYAKTQTEIQTDMNSCYDGTETGLVAFWDLEDGTGSGVATDLTGNGNNGTLTSMDPSTDWVSGVTCYECDLEMADMITITVGDTENPTASNPVAVNVECIGNVPAPDVTVVTDEADNCDANPTVAFVSDVSDGNTCPEVITRTYSVTDASANSINVTQTITVNDVTNPTASNPVAVNVECIGDVPAADVSVVTDEADNCTTAPVVAFVSDVSDGNTCPEVITRTYSVTDDCGNSINVTQTITVNDVTNPTASNPVAVNVECIGDVPAADVSVVTDEADNCTTAPVVAFVSDVSDGNTCPEVITRTYSVTDDCGNSTNVTQTITVNDITNPTASNPAAINVECAADVPSADISVVTDEADNCTVAPTVAFVSDVTDGLSNPETITRTYSVTDDCGNSINVSQAIVINDITAPVISGCPSNISQVADASGCTSNVTWTAPTATDNCSASPTISASHAPGSSFGLGTTTVTYTFTDDAGNMSTCSFDVTITSDLTVSPTIPTNASCNGATDGQASVNVSGGTTAYTFDWDNDGTGDNDDVEDLSGIGAGTYNLIVTDANGCTATTSSTISEPTAVTVDAIVGTDPSACGVTDGSIALTVSGGSGLYAFDWDNDGTGDFDDVEDLSGIGSGIYNVEVQDGNGCSATASVNLSDPLGPVVTITSTTNNVCFEDANGSIDATIVGGLAPLTIDWDNDGTGDNDDTEDLSGLTANTYNLVVTDANGCVGSTSANITDPAEIYMTELATICSNDSLFLEGAYQTTAGIYMDTLSTVVNGCDSIIETTLSINLAHEITMTPVTICDGDSVMVFGTYYSIAGIYYDSLMTTNSCDSVLIQEVIINSVDATVSASGTELTANAAGTGVTYQWIDCSDNSVITGETNQVFNATANGDYAVIVEDNGCIDTSGCETISGIGFDELELTFNVYPNPNQGEFVVQFDQELNEANLEIYSLS
ncbi:MAG: LamG-like jellyroll fold domain-containing protein, partial [Crocinitomicaceae bacterium]